ncbi:MAG TPA: hypothetical protein VF605_02845 [Allosphingosinicella sp.]
MAAEPDESALTEWLNQVDLDNGPRAARAGAASPASYPADYIRRAIIGHHRGDRKIYSGIEARGMRFAGDLNLQNLEIPFPLFFIGCTFEGAIDARAVSAKTLGFTSSKLMLGADLRNARVDGHVFMRGAFEAHAPVLLRDARIEGSLDLTGGRFLHKSKGDLDECLGLSRAEAKALLWSHAPPDETAETHRPEVAAMGPQGRVNLRDVTVRSFRHDFAEAKLSAWPAEGNLILDGFTYEHFDEASGDTLMAWLALQDGTSAAPYFTLASVLQKQGRRDEAVRIRAQVRRNEVAGYGWFKKLIAKIFFWPVDYGAKPTRALWPMAFLLFLYFIAVALLGSNGRMAPSASGLLFNPCYYGAATCKEDLARWQRIAVDHPRGTIRYVPPDYPALSPVQYSLEAFLPFVNFDQSGHWEPASAGVRLLLALIALTGLFLGSLFFAAVTGLLRPRES